MRLSLIAPLLAGAVSLLALNAANAADFKLMTLNIWYGGVQVDFLAVAEAIRAADPDVIAVAEPEANLRAIAAAAGYTYVSEALHLISRKPIFPSSENGLAFGYVALDPEHVVAVASMHLTSDPYGPYMLLRDGATVEAVLANEAETRLPEIAPYTGLASLAERGVPVFVAGDFNTPSHQDWTAEAVTAGMIPAAVEWPVTKALSDAGFSDAYRNANPDPVANPGVTWTPGTPPPHADDSRTLQRIDMIWSAGPAQTLASTVVGETGGPDVGIGIDVWPADHRGVVASFDVQPAAASLLVSVDNTVVRQGDILTARYLMPFVNEGRKLAIVDADGNVVQSLPVIDGTDHRAVRFGTQPVAPGSYSAALIAADGSIEATTPFWILARDAQPEVSVAADATLEINWKNGPANRLDWIGIYPAGETDLYNYYGFYYTGASSTGSMSLDTAELGLEPGSYEVRLVLDDGYSTLATSTPFEIKAN